MDHGDAPPSTAAAEGEASRVGACIAERAHHLGLNPRTAKAYVRWVRRFIVWAGGRSARSLGRAEVEAFLQHLVHEQSAAPSTRRQAHSALGFLYDEVLRVDDPGSRRPAGPALGRHSPVLLEDDTIRRALAAMQPPRGRAAGADTALLAQLIHRTGLHAAEAVRLQCDDVDLKRLTLVVRASPDSRNRELPLPAELRSAMRRQLRAARACRHQDQQAGLAHGAAGTGPQALPPHLHPAASEAPCWLFPATASVRDPGSGGRCRPHLGEKRLQADLKRAAVACGLDRPLTAAMLRLAFVARCLHDSEDLRTLQHRLGAGASRAIAAGLRALAAAAAPQPGRPASPASTFPAVEGDVPAIGSPPARPAAPDAAPQGGLQAYRRRSVHADADADAGPDELDAPDWLVSRSRWSAEEPRARWTVAPARQPRPAARRPAGRHLRINPQTGWAFQRRPAAAARMPHSRRWSAPMLAAPPAPTSWP